MTEATETSEAQAPAATPSETVTIDNVNTFAACIAQWHKMQTDRIRHLLTIPKGATFTIGEEELVINDANLAGFKFGVELALMQVSELPFVVEFEEQPVEAPAEG